MNKYDKIMKDIKVTPEMRERILKNISEKVAKKNQPFYVKYKAWLAAAACLAVFVTGGIILAGIQNAPIPKPPDSNVLAQPDLAECADISELSEKIGFEVREPDDLPFEFDDTVYTMLWGEIAEITWTNGGEYAGYFRMALGSEDVSGDHTSYPEITAIAINGTDVTIKGENGKYSAAVWTDEEFIYSLNLTSAISEEQLAAIIKTAI